MTDGRRKGFLFYPLSHFSSLFSAAAVAATSVVSTGAAQDTPSQSQSVCESVMSRALSQSVLGCGTD